MNRQHYALALWTRSQRGAGLRLGWPLALLTLLGALQSATGAYGQAEYFSEEDYYQVEKIDMHMHVHTENLDFVALAKRDRFRFVNMAVWSGKAADNQEKHRTMFLQYQAEPNRTAPICSFPLENWDEPDWVEQTIEYLDNAFAQGAVGVKVWKNIGMELRDQQGRLVMIDDPKFDPVFEHLIAQDKVLLGHLGEPKNCWLPLEEMTTNNDRSYFQEHPKYHMYLHPEMPSYEEQIAARDRMLAKHPQLTFVGAHLASLEWSVDRIAAFLDRFPKATVGVAARMGQLQYQTQRDRERVIDFLTQYQDRIMYGSDTGVGPDTQVARRYEQLHYKWLRDWKFFTTDEMVSVPELDDPVQGVKLPKTIVEKIYRLNPRRVFADSWRQ